MLKVRRKIFTSYRLDVFGGILGDLTSSVQAISIFFSRFVDFLQSIQVQERVWYHIYPGIIISTKWLSLQCGSDLDAISLSENIAHLYTYMLLGAWVIAWISNYPNCCYTLHMHTASIAMHNRTHNDYNYKTWNIFFYKN